MQDLQIKAGKRLLIQAEVKLGKTYSVIHDYAVPLFRQGYKILYLTLDSVAVRNQEKEELLKAGFKNIFVAGEDTLDLRNLDSIDAAIFTTNYHHDKNLQTLINHWHIKNNVLFINDEYDFPATGTKDYTALKNSTVSAALKALREDDYLICVSATHSQLLTMPITFTDIKRLTPYKDGYSSTLGLTGTKHKRLKIEELDFEQFINEDLIPNSILNILNNCTVTEKGYIKLTRWVTEREIGLYIPKLKEKIQRQTGKKVYEAVGGKDVIFRDDPEYHNSEIIIGGQPTTRAVHLPNIKYTIAKINKVMDTGIQEFRMDGYANYERTIYTNVEGMQRLQEYDKFANLIDKNLEKLMCMSIKEKEAWVKEELKTFYYIEFFSTGKRGQYKTKKGEAQPITKIPYHKDLVQELKEPLVDKVRITKGTEGTYRYGNDEAHKEQMTRQHPSSNTKIKGLEQRKSGVVCGNPKKQGGNLAVVFSAFWTEGLTKWWQVIFEEGKLFLCLFDDTCFNKQQKYIEVENYE